MIEKTSRKTIWLLGAGASKSASAGTLPVLLEIPSVAAKLGVHVARSSGRPGPYEALKAYVSDKFDVDLAQGPRLDLEAVLTMLDIDRALDAAPASGRARAQLIRYLQDTFRRLHQNPTTSAPEYEKLVQRLGTSDTVITFNWDLLLDNALGREAILGDLTIKPNRPQYSAFVLDFTALGDSTIGKLSLPKPFRRWDPEHGYFLKLHGSIDWVWCDRGGCKNAGRVFPMVKYGTRPACGYCFEKMQWLIVPPTLNKRLLETPIVRRLWNVAARELAQAEVLVVWGYSLPPTDFFSAWLLRTISPQRLAQVILINPALIRGSRKSPKLSRMFLNRFDHLLRSGMANGSVHLHLTFADYVDSLDLRGRYPHLVREIDRYLAKLQQKPASSPIPISPGQV